MRVWLTSVQSPSLSRQCARRIFLLPLFRAPPMTMNRRDWLHLALAGIATSALSRRAHGELFGARKTRIAVYKSPTCGCCGNWVEYMQHNGFVVDAHDVGEQMLEQV